MTRRRRVLLGAALGDRPGALVGLDPAVKAGIFEPDLTPWYGPAAMLLVNETHKRIERPKR